MKKILIISPHPDDEIMVAGRPCQNLKISQSIG